MGRRTAGIVAGLTLAVAVISVQLYAGGPTPPETVTIKAVQKIKPPVVMPHAKHAKEIAKGDCSTCHHKWDKASGKNPRACTTCHKKTAGEAPAAKTIFHKKCKSCHKKNKDKGAPTKCSGCHKK